MSKNKPFLFDISKKKGFINGVQNLYFCINCQFLAFQHDENQFSKVVSKSHGDKDSIFNSQRSPRSKIWGTESKQ